MPKPKQVKLPSDWKDLKLPLGLVLALIAAVIYVRSEFVLAADFQQYRNEADIRSLERDKKAVELEKLKLDIKKQVYPKRFDAIDRAVLEKHNTELSNINRDLKDLKQRGNK